MYHLQLFVFRPKPIFYPRAYVVLLEIHFNDNYNFPPFPASILGLIRNYVRSIFFKVMTKEQMLIYRAIYKFLLKTQFYA